MAAAHVSGVAALLREQRPRLSAAELKPLLMGSVSPTGDTRQGLNACAALSRLMEREGCAEPSARETSGSAR
jgi:subtilisin family serine protease